MKTQYLVTLGRQPAISLAEIEAVYGAEAIVSQQGGLAIVAEEIDIARLGGSQKLAKVVAESETTDWPALSAAIKDYAAHLSSSLEEGKLTLGLSLHGIKASPKDISKCLMDIKTSLKTQGRSVRVVESRSTALSGAQVLHNKLFKPKKVELSLVRYGQQTLLAQTVAIQNIDAYARRDQGRPARDAKVGMLPPKLAQILVNLAVGQSSSAEVAVLDPFCGTGVVLQESLLLGHNALGTDLDERMVDYSRRNIEWLWNTHRLQELSWDVEVGDAAAYSWQKPFTHVAGETYLGEPLQGLAKADDLQRIVPGVNKLHVDFLRNIAQQLSPGQRLALGVPAWANKNGGFTHLPLLDSIGDIGYNRLDFAHASQQELIYHRPGQAVAREILVIEKK